MVRPALRCMRGIRLLPLLTCSWSACVPIPISTAAPAELQRMSAEQLLRHRRPTFDLLARYEPAGATFVDATLKGESSVTLVHVWSIYCPPCRAELPGWAELVAVLRRHHPDLRVVFVAEDDLSELKTFLQRNRGRLPPVEQFAISADSRLRSELNDRSQPLTLILNRQQEIREAFIGPIEARRNEIISVLDRLAQSERASLPKVQTSLRHSTQPHF